MAAGDGGEQGADEVLQGRGRVAVEGGAARSVIAPYRKEGVDCGAWGHAPSRRWCRYSPLVRARAERTTPMRAVRTRHQALSTRH